MGKQQQRIKLPSQPSFVKLRLYEIQLILVSAITLFMFIALFSYNTADPSWSHLVSQPQVHNAAGVVGAWVADIMLLWFGYMAYAFPLLLWIGVWRSFREKKNNSSREVIRSHKWLRLAGFVFLMLSTSALMTLHIWAISPLPSDTGGIVGDLVGGSLTYLFHMVGASLLLVSLFLIGVTMYTGLSWLTLLERVGHGTWSVFLWLFKSVSTVSYADHCKKFCTAVADCCKKLWSWRLKKQAISASPQIAALAASAAPTVINTPTVTVMHEPVQGRDQDIISQQVVKKSKKSIFKSKARGMPSLDLLDQTVASKSTPQTAQSYLEKRSREVEQCMVDFGIDVSVVAVYPGPVVTRYELDLAAGTKVSKISNLAKDLARSLSVMSVRVVEVIPGKSVIGLELPNDTRQLVSLEEVLASQPFRQSHAVLPLALGKDIAGYPVVVDLSKMPHLLVAGTTGSGKSVGLNAMLMSLLYRCGPEQLRLIMIDPKMLELAIYDDIPHLLTPVVTDMKKAAVALRWCVVEMERRYRLMSALGVRNLAGYNKKVKAAIDAGEPMADPFGPPGEESLELEPLPHIVVVADEFADMMMVVGKKVETLICRIAQKARAAGIHLILATQRPSVDVITGLIKANVPTRIAFQVSSKVDSRTIIDQQGAEQLLGHGDMLYLPPGSGVPVRVHGAYVSDDEVHRVVAFLKQSSEPQYLDDVIDEESLTGGDLMEPPEMDSEQDELYDQAVYFVTKSRKASVSSVQRRFRIGYNRASCMVEAMERAGVVSSAAGGAREVLAPAPRE